MLLGQWVNCKSNVLQRRDFVKVSSNNQSINILDVLDIVKINATVSIDGLVEIKMLEKSSSHVPWTIQHVHNRQLTEIEGAGQNY